MIRTFLNFKNAQFVYGVSQISFQAGTQALFLKWQIYNTSGLYEPAYIRVGQVNFCFSVFAFFLFCHTSFQLFSLIFHVSCTSPRSGSCGRHLSSSFHKLFILPPRYVSCFLSSCSDLSVSSSLLYISFLCDFSNMWNTNSYFHATVILAPICLKKLEDKLTELFFMTWIFEYLQFSCT